MFEVIVVGGTVGNEIVAVATVKNDWMRTDMAAALELVGAVKTSGGSPGTKGMIEVAVRADSLHKVQGFRDYLSDAKWEYRTLKGYGLFIEGLLEVERS